MAFSCEAGWGAEPPVALPLSFTDQYKDIGKEFAHFTVYGVAVDLQYHSVTVPRVGKGDVTWQDYVLEYYAHTTDGFGLNIGPSQLWTYRVYDVAHSQCVAQ